MGSWCGVAGAVPSRLRCSLWVSGVSVRETWRVLPLRPRVRMQGGDQVYTTFPLIVEDSPVAQLTTNKLRNIMCFTFVISVCWCHFNPWLNRAEYIYFILLCHCLQYSRKHDLISDLNDLVLLLPHVDTKDKRFWKRFVMTWVQA